MKQRLAEFKKFYGYYDEVTRVMKGYPKVHFRHLMEPLVPLGGGPAPLFAGTDVNIKLMEQG